MHQSALFYGINKSFPKYFLQETESVTMNYSVHKTKHSLSAQAPRPLSAQSTSHGEQSHAVIKSTLQMYAATAGRVDSGTKSEA